MKSTRKPFLQIVEREPYGPVSDLVQAPTALIEILMLSDDAAKGDVDASGKIKAIIRDVIEVVLGDPEGLLKLEEMRNRGYRLAYISDISDDSPTKLPVNHLAVVQ